MGAGIYKDNREAFATLDRIEVIEPKESDRQAYSDAYGLWKERLNQEMNK